MSRHDNIVKWYQKAIGYEIYPYSFYDANNDGYGDLRGIIEKMDYLATLGVTLIWLCPVFKSPLDDNGYDVSDFYEINPLLGSNDDLDELIEQAHKRGIKVILDLVLNHVSSEHFWFKEAIRDVNSKYHDYFIFRDPVFADGRKCRPNNWEGFFSESVWSYVEEIDQYYMHIFSERMPDLNWENPVLRQQMHEVARYYLDKGIDGFRLDAVAHLSKDTTFTCSPIKENENGLAYDTDRFSNREKLFEYLDEFKKEVFDKYDCLIIGEVGGCASTQLARRYSDRNAGSINMVFNFDTCWENGAYGSVNKSDDEIKTDLVSLKKNFKRWYDDCHPYCDMPVYWLNHDHPRLMSQYGDLEYRKESGKMLETVLMMLYGLPFIYQGEEIGMSNVNFDDIEDFYSDVNARNFVKAARRLDGEIILRFLRRCSRVNARTPMQWSADSNAGFSRVPPYIKVNDNYPEVNVEKEISDPDSILNYLRELIKLRKKYNDVVYFGTFEILDEDNDRLFVFRKSFEDVTLLVIASFTAENMIYEVPGDFDILISNQKSGIEGNELLLGAYGCYVIRLKD